MVAGNRGDTVITCSIVTVLIAAVVVILRLFTRSKILNFVGREDWCILAALFYSVANTIRKCFPVLVCVPAAHWWDSAHASGICIPEKPLWFANASLNIVTDVGIILLPMPVISTLVLPRKKKFGLYFIFALGFFVCIISFLRIHWLILAASTTDPTWDNIGIANWS
ncbi:uncharacterized protein PAC_07486 [Phialocephala subalpina]|uniref:Rhodopsin domain-containing protein n=1 Tax=Phialocephala subalpina TaxID=576137 RepID=A0A1L7WXV2_9HELO|nr:uncharacterized protein PAC_07486 [Phialocephala subalpina]